MQLSATSRRLLFAFGALVVCFAVTSFITLEGLAGLHRLAHEVQHGERARRLAAELAIAVRERSAVQAHAILDREVSGLRAQKGLALDALLKALEEEPLDGQQKRALAEARSASAELDRVEREQLIPGIENGSEDREGHARADARARLARIQMLADEIRVGLDRSIGRLDEHAGLVQHSSVRWTVGALAAAIVLALVLGVYITRSVALPVAKLTDGAARLATGDLGTRIDVGDRADEFGRLARQFNQMAAALGDHQAKLIQSEKLAGIGRLAAGVAHEINNPLGVILGYARLLGRAADGQLRDELKIIEDEALRCQEIVEGLLDLARPPRISLETTSLRALCEQVVVRLREAEPGTTVQFTVEGDATVQGGPAGLRQILWNVMRNAAEAAGPAGRVGVRIEGDEQGARVSIMDNGPGVAAADRARLFEPFFTTKPTGTGLGLAVSRSIARAHGGDLVAEAGSEGATFTLRLPRRPEVMA